MRSLRIISRDRFHLIVANHPQLTGPVHGPVRHGVVQQNCADLQIGLVRDGGDWFNESPRPFLVLLLLFFVKYVISPNFGRVLEMARGTREPKNAPSAVCTVPRTSLAAPRIG